MRGWLATRLGDSLHALGRVAREPDLRRLLLAQVASLIGQWGSTVAVAVWAFNRGGAGLVGVATFVRMMPAAIIGPFTGLVADRLPRLRVMIGCDLARAALLALVTLAVATSAPAAAVLVPLAFVSILSNLFRPAQAALLPSLAREPEDLTAANAAASTVEGVGIFVGPALGGVLLVVTSPQAVFACTGVTLLLSVALIARITYREARREARPTESAAAVAHEALGGFRLVAANPDLRVLTSLFAAQTLVAGLLSVLVAATALDVLDRSDAWVGYLTSALGLGGIAGGLVAGGLAGRRRLGSVLAVAMLAWSVPLIVMGGIPVAGVALLMMAVVGVGSTVGDVCVFTLLQRAVPDELLARVFAIVESLIVGPIALGGLIAPLLIDVTSVKAALIITGLFLPVVTLLARPGLARIDRGAAAPEDLGALREIPLFAPLNPATLEQLATSLAHVTVPAGATVFAQGDPGDRYYLIAEGEAEAQVDGRPTRVMHAGEAFGEIALLRDTPRTATVHAHTPLRLLALDREAFLGAVAGHAASAEAAEHVVAAHLAHARPALAAL